MVHLVDTLRIAADVAVAVHLRAPFLLGTCHVHLAVHRGMRNAGRNAVHLTLGIGGEMADSTVIPAKYIAHVCRTPAS